MRIALLDDYQKVALKSADWSRLAGCCTVEAFHDHLVDENAVAKRLADFEVVMALRERTRFPASLLERLPKLKLLASVGPRNASIDLAAATRLGIMVTYTAGAPDSTGELTWALILGLARKVPQEHAALRTGRWQTTIGIEMAGRTLGVVGLGHIGGRVAQVGRAFGMRVIAWSQNLTAERAREVGAEKVGLETLLRQADVITLHTRLSERTRGLLGAKELALMKPTALLVNTSRAPIVDQAALVDALRNRRLSGAAVDVYEREPAPADDPLLHLDNVVTTPHLGYVTEEVYRVFYGQTLENILAYIEKGAPERLLNPEVLAHKR
jgi:phosphoglycerate dehydrogenase-like enzyme